MTKAKDVFRVDERGTWCTVCLECLKIGTGFLLIETDEPGVIVCERCLKEAVARIAKVDRDPT